MKTTRENATGLVVAFMVAGADLNRRTLGLRSDSPFDPQRSYQELPKFGVPVLCHMSHTDRLKFAGFLRSVGATSVRAGCRQVIEVLAIVIESAFSPDNGRLFGVLRFRPARWVVINNLR
jgi:hypothetical protein